MIHSIAGELGLDIYIISLSRIGLDDTSLNDLISDLPEKCIALMEDIDAAFHQGLNRDESDSQDSNETKPQTLPNGMVPPPPRASSRISLSGLLNALDGVGAQEGRLLYATTNKFSALDPALCRPGRMDLHVEFKLASKFQARELFRAFYLPPQNSNDEDTGDDVVDSGYNSPAKRDRDLIDLDEKSQQLDTNPGSIAPVTPATVTDSNGHRSSRLPHLSRHQVLDLACDFSESLPDREFSMASLQGYLMMYKTRPFEAVTEFSAWIEKERVERIEKEKMASPPTKVATP